MGNPLGFKTEEHRRVHELTRDYLYSLFGEVNIKSIGETFALQEGSAFVYVRAFSIDDDTAGVEVFSHVVTEIDLAPELLLYLLTQNLRLTLGAFGVAAGDDGKGSVLLSHSIIGTRMQPEELWSSVRAIASTADEMDDQIAGTFGGITALDKLRETTHLVRWE